MKTKIYTSILLLICATSLNAQLLSDFEGGGVGLSVSYMNLDTAAIIANPDKSGTNTSDSVLIYDRINDGSYDSIWNAIVFLKPLSTQTTQNYTRLFFKAYANVSGEFYVRIWTGGTQLVQNWAYPSQITADTWVQESLDLTGLNWNNIDSISLEFGDWVKVTDSTTSVTGDGYIVFIDDVELGYYMPDCCSPEFQSELINFIDPANAPDAIDGEKDAAWDTAYDEVPIANSLDSIGPQPYASDISGSFSAMWDSLTLYLFIEITDDVVINYLDAGGTNPEKNDGIEIYTDGTARNYIGNRVNSQQVQSRINFGRDSYEIGGPNKSIFGADTIKWAEKTVAGGYNLEMAIPLFYFYRPYATDSAEAMAIWADRAWPGDSLGLEISILDADVVDSLDNMLNWSNPTEINQSPTNSEYYGHLIFDGSYCILSDCDWSLKDNTNLKVSIYPNPAESFVNIEMINLSKIEIYSIDGRILMQQKAENGIAKAYVSTLKNGMYLIKATNKDNQFITAKFQKF